MCRAGGRADCAAERIYRIGHFDQAQGVRIDVSRPAIRQRRQRGIVLRDASRGVYKRLVVKDDRLVGAVLYGDTSDGNWYFDLLKRGEDIAPLRDSLIFGQAFAEGGGAGDPNAAVAALPDSAEICGCNGVCKGKITGAIADGATRGRVRGTTSERLGGSEPVSRKPARSAGTDMRRAHRRRWAKHSLACRRAAVESSKSSQESRVMQSCMVNRTLLVCRPA